MLLTPDTIELVIQGGAIGLLLMFGVMGYRLARLSITKGFEFVSNHLEHNTDAVKEGTEVMREVVTEVRNMSHKLDKRD